jgi:hypothetical protein
MKKRTLSILLTMILILLYSCDEGLAPPPPVIPAIISGRIVYKKGIPWPPSDSVKDIRLAVFKTYPPANIIEELTNGNAYFSESLPLFVDSADFKLIIPKPPVLIKYIVAAQQYGSLFEWKAIGVWTLTGDAEKPSELMIQQGDSIPDIRINVDFQNLPPQPFK